MIISCKLLTDSPHNFIPKYYLEAAKYLTVFHTGEKILLYRLHSSDDKLGLDGKSIELVIIDKVKMGDILIPEGTNYEMQVTKIHKHG